MNIPQLLIKYGFVNRGNIYYSSDNKYSWTSYDNDPDIVWNLHIVRNGYADDVLFIIEDEQTLTTILKAVRYEFKETSV